MITEKQKQATMLYASGLTYAEVGKRMGCSTQCAQGHVKNFALHILTPYRRTKCVYPEIERYIIDEAISQREFAQRVGIDPVTISNILRGKNRVRIDIAMKIAKVVGLPVEQTFRREDEDHDF